LSKKSGAFDFNLGCSGYIYGLGIAKGLILTNQASRVLLLTGEAYTKYINPLDKGNKTIFGDAGTATLISNEKIESGINASILDFSYGTDGSGAEHLIVKNGALRHKELNGDNKLDENGDFLSNDDNLYMNGKEIFNFTAFMIPPLINEVITKNKTTLDNIDFFFFHQANEFMLNTVRKRCSIPEEKFFVDIKDIGNTVSNTLPIALSRASESGLLKNKEYILLSGFGVGLSMGAVILKVEI
jgi:3-oxoacyl-[acyl-carrier-protein] synthase-3